MFDEKLYFKQYRERNKEKLRAYFHEYYQRNKGKITARSRQTWHDLDKVEYLKTRNEREANWIPERKEKKKLTVREKARMKILRRHSMTPEQYESMSISQGYACAICLRIPNHRLHVDHDHKTNKVRGLLCRNCNTAIGLLRENPAVMLQAIKYLN